MSDLIKKIIQDTRVKLAEEFDRNFETKSFFGEQWKQSKYPNHKGSLMMRTGALRKSINSSIRGTTITFSSSLPYAAIHNEGGEITVTAKMKKFFWAKHYEASGGSKELIRGKKKERLTAEATFWKNMALMKLGSKIKIEKRQFIGDHSQINSIVNKVVSNNTKELENYIKTHFKPKK